MRYILGIKDVFFLPDFCISVGASLSNVFNSFLFALLSNLTFKYINSNLLPIIFIATKPKRIYKGVFISSSLKADGVWNAI